MTGRMWLLASAAVLQLVASMGKLLANSKAEFGFLLAVFGFSRPRQHSLVVLLAQLSPIKKAELRGSAFREKLH